MIKLTWRDFRQISTLKTSLTDQTEKKQNYFHFGTENYFKNKNIKKRNTVPETDQTEREPKLLC